MQHVVLLEAVGARDDRRAAADGCSAAWGRPCRAPVEEVLPEAARGVDRDDVAVLVDERGRLHLAAEAAHHVAAALVAALVLELPVEARVGRRPRLELGQLLGGGGHHRLGEIDDVAEHGELRVELDEARVLAGEVAAQVGLLAREGELRADLRQQRAARRRQLHPRSKRKM